MRQSSVGFLLLGQLAIQDAFENGSLDPFWIWRTPDLFDLLDPHLEKGKLLLLP